MLQLLVRLMPAHVVHEFGRGRALDNARIDHDEVARTTALVDDLVGRLESGATARRVITPVAA